MKMSLIVLPLVAGFTATTALAGNMTSPEPEPALAYVEPAAAPTADWTGGYIGAQIGYGDVGTSSAGVEGDGVIGGIIAGYDFDFGNWVAGVGLDYDFTDIDLGGAAAVENVLRVKARGGVKLGSGLAYLTAGYANASTDKLGSDGGWLAGVGYEHKLNDRFSLGAEILYHEFSDFNGSGIDVDATTVQVRAAYRF